MKKIFAALNALLIVAVVIGDICYINHGTLKIKAAASILFTLLGAVNLAYTALARRPLGYAAVLTAGLFFAMLGDIMLRCSFVLGALLFGIGHILYFAAFCALKRLRLIDLLPSALIFAGAALLLFCYPEFDFGGMTMLRVCMFYAAVISLMTGKSISNFIRDRDTSCAIAMLGSVFFFVSDLMLVLYRFADAPRIVDTLCLVFYYPGQCLLGFSIFNHVRCAVSK